MTYEYLVRMNDMNEVLVLFFRVPIGLGYVWLAMGLLLLLFMTRRVRVSSEHPAPQCVILPVTGGPFVGFFMYLAPFHATGIGGWRYRFGLSAPVDDDMATGPGGAGSVFSISALRRIYRVRRIYGLLGWIFAVQIPFYVLFLLWVWYIWPLVARGWTYPVSPLDHYIVVPAFFPVILGMALTAFRIARETFAARGISCVERQGDAITVISISGKSRTFPMPAATVARPARVRPSVAGYLRAALSLKRCLPRLIIQHEAGRLVIPACVPGAPNVMAAIMSMRDRLT